jgi:hypothetical protein
LITSPPWHVLPALPTELTPAQREAAFLWRVAGIRDWEDCLAEAEQKHPPPPCRLARVASGGAQSVGWRVARYICACGYRLKCVIERRETGWHIYPDLAGNHGPAAWLLGDALTRMEEENAVAYIQGLQDIAPTSWLAAFAASCGWSPR